MKSRTTGGKAAMLGTTRRDFLRYCGAGAAALTIPAFPARAARNPDDRPNIIFILADDMGYGDLGCFGSRDILTPELDAIAEEGIKLTDFYAGSAVCMPARSTLYTGLHSGHTRHHGSNQHTPMHEDDLCIAAVMKAAGYHTGMIGKWAMGDDHDGSGAVYKHGWDYYYGEPNQSRCHYYYLDEWYEYDRDGLVSGEPTGDHMRTLSFPNNSTTKEHYSHDYFTQQALAYIQAVHDRPFFLYIPYMIPHTHLAVPEIEEPYKEKPWNKYEKMYASMVTRMDRDIGKMKELIEDLGLGENTLIMFTSDNGPSGSNGTAHPLRGTKFSLYEGGIRVPTVARWRGRIPAKTISDYPCAFWDMMPTFAEMAGINAPENIDGLSILPLLLGESTGPEREYLYWEYTDHGDGKAKAVRMGTWKGVGLPPDLELYDLSTDIGETTDLAASHPDIVNRMVEIINEAHTDAVIPVWEPTPNRSPAEARLFRPGTPVIEQSRTHLTARGEGPLGLSLFNARGALVAHRKGFDTIAVSLKGLPRGMYSVAVRGASGSVATRSLPL